MIAYAEITGRCQGRSRGAADRQRELMLEQTIVTTMCALINRQDEVLFINRKKDWQGLALPGGHIEGDESIHDCIVREMKEETGLNVNSLHFRGMTHFYNGAKNERYLIFNFASNDFDGDLVSACDEGTLQWIPRSRLDDYEYAPGMAERLPLFFEEDISEYYVVWKEDVAHVRVQRGKDLGKPK